MNVITNSDIKCNVALVGLENVYDPEIGLNVVDLGLIYELDFNDVDRKIDCYMTLTTQFCPMGESIVGNVKQSLQCSFPEDTVEVTLVFDPPWNYERISESGQKFLNKE